MKKSLKPVPPVGGNGQAGAASGSQNSDMDWETLPEWDQQRITMLMQAVSKTNSGDREYLGGVKKFLRGGPV